MGWSKQGGKLFFYRRRRVGGRIVTSYVGRGPVAQLAADLEALQRHQREAGWAAQRAEKQRWKAADAGGVNGDEKYEEKPWRQHRR